MKWFTYDSRGRESKTYRVVMFSWLAVFIKFLFAGATLPVFGLVPSMTATEFGAATAAILLIWLGREWVKK